MSDDITKRLLAAIPPMVRGVYVWHTFNPQMAVGALIEAVNEIARLRALCGDQDARRRMRAANSVLSARNSQLEAAIVSVVSVQRQLETELGAARWLCGEAAREMEKMQSEIEQLQYELLEQGGS